ncbi:hypothetical protein Prudu_1497S000100, partial [Prunus dulcis]
FNHKRFLKTLGSNSLDGLPDFQFEAIPYSQIQTKTPHKVQKRSSSEPPSSSKLPDGPSNGVRKKRFFFCGETEVKFCTDEITSIQVGRWITMRRNPVLGVNLMGSKMMRSLSNPYCYIRGVEEGIESHRLAQ